jgi:hypothetical protein
MIPVAGHALFDFGPRAPQPRSHGSERDAERVCDLRSSKAFDFEQDERCPQIFGELAQHSVEKVAGTALVEQIVGRRNWRRLFAVLEPRGVRPAPEGPARVRRNASGGPIEEASLRTLLDGSEPGGCD